MKDNYVTFVVAGTVLVTFSFAFIYNKCFICDQLTTDWKLFAWYAPYVIVFQIGWAAVQVITFCFVYSTLIYHFLFLNLFEL